MKLRAWLVFVAAFLGACSKPLPPEKLEFVGLWKNNLVSLLITADGRLEYVSKSGSVQKSISAPIKTLTDTVLSAGFLFINADFSIDRAPKQENGIWSMVVDGQELFKADEFGHIPQTLAMPTLDTLRQLVDADLRRLARGIRTNDFKEFIDGAALTFQSQIDNERLREAYKTFTGKGLDLEQYMTGDFVLVKEPTISAEGELVVIGRYTAGSTAFDFDLSYVYAQPTWKTIGAAISLQPQSRSAAQ